MATNCKHCGKELPEQQTGRRPREYCDNNNYCRNQYHEKKKKDKVEADAELVFPKPKVFFKETEITDGCEILADKIILPEVYDGKKLSLYELDEVGQTDVAKEFDIASLKKVFGNDVALSALKFICPIKAGVDRTEWLSNEKEKYGL